jgi:predicted naringenin-chalcone synthase
MKTLAALVIAVCLFASCHNVKPDAFLNAVVDCAKINPQSSAALAQVETCLMSLLSKNYAACLSGLVTDAHFAVDEIACVVAWEAQQTNVAVAQGKATDADLQARRAAVDWLKQENISIRNSYSPGR